ncbi:hypothetical protein ACWFNE_07790 [Cellulomonas sp. NPDC055163]
MSGGYRLGHHEAGEDARHVEIAGSGVDRDVDPPAGDESARPVERTGGLADDCRPPTGCPGAEHTHLDLPAPEARPTFACVRFAGVGGDPGVPVEPCRWPSLG